MDSYDTPNNTGNLTGKVILSHDFSASTDPGRTISLEITPYALYGFFLMIKTCSVPILQAIIQRSGSSSFLPRQGMFHCVGISGKQRSNDTPAPVLNVSGLLRKNPETSGMFLFHRSLIFSMVHRNFLGNDKKSLQFRRQDAV
jgi:hypothetical protein